jgi:CRISPR/Cas system-associated exonuclease Cas4 (RecB family)
MSYKWIRASEIGEFVYCRKAWWFRRVKGKKPASIQRLEKGSRYHRQHGSQVRKGSWMRGLAYVLIFVVVAVLVFQLLIGI